MMLRTIVAELSGPGCWTSRFGALARERPALCSYSTLKTIAAREGVKPKFLFAEARRLGHLRDVSTDLDPTVVVGPGGSQVSADHELA